MESRRQSNHLATSVRIEQLRDLQHQLANMIQEEEDIPHEQDDDVESALGDSARSGSAGSYSHSRAGGRSERASSNNNDDGDAFELSLSSLPPVYKPKRRSPPLRQQPEAAAAAEEGVPVAAPPSNPGLRPSEMTVSAMTDATADRTASAGTDADPPATRASSSGTTASALRRRLRGSGRTSRRTKVRPSLFNREVVVKATKNRRQAPQRLPTYEFLEKEKDQDLEEGSLRPGAKWWHGVFFFSFISMVACVVTLWAPYPYGARMPSAAIAEMPWSDGCQWGLATCICPRETICADDLPSMIFLTIARTSAWFDYPLYMLLFLSKANNLNNFLQKTALRCWINFSDYHHVHSLFGIIVGIESASHSFFHILRWARRQDDIQLLWSSRTGLTGLIAISMTPFIVLPMTMPYLKQRMRFEWRKGLHYLSIVWGACLMCHAPQRIFWLIGVPFFIYVADKMVKIFFRTHLVESAFFRRLGDQSCIISFENPPGFGKQNSAYIYLMLPWLSKYQFHAFTVFPCTKPNHSSVCIYNSGDWTDTLMKTITTPTHKPAFVVGPFLSPFSSPAMDCENLVAVASGIGVTPAISLIRQYSGTSRRLNLVWICRDAGLVEHFLENVDFGTDGYTLIYYTGKDRSVILRDGLPPNVFLFNGRPNLERTISGIIASIATGEGLPEELHKKVLTSTPAELRSKLLLDKALSIYTMDQLFDYTVKASNYYDEGGEPLVAAVNYQGVRSTMKHLLGDEFECAEEKIAENFEKIKVDTVEDCRMDRDDFEFFFNLMNAGFNAQSVSDAKLGMERVSNAQYKFRRASTIATPKAADAFDLKKHLNGDGKFSAKNWNMLYCGGSQPVVDQLKELKRKFGIGLSVEKFDW